MIIKDRLKSLGTQLVALVTPAFASMTEAINEYTKICEADNQLASVSSYDFVWAFKDTAMAICECRTTPNTETYISLCDEAMKRLISGDEQADVLCYFDLLLEKERKGIVD